MILPFLAVGVLALAQPPVTAPPDDPQCRVASERGGPDARCEAYGNQPGFYYRRQETRLAGNTSTTARGGRCDVGDQGVSAWITYTDPDVTDSGGRLIEDPAGHYYEYDLTNAGKGAAWVTVRTQCRDDTA